MTLPEARAKRAVNRRRMKTASPECQAIRERLDRLYGEYIAAMRRNAA